MGILVLAILIGLIPAIIAQGKGRSFLGWWLFGALLFIVALPIILVLDPLPGSQKAKEMAALTHNAPGARGPTSVADEIAKAKHLLDTGALTQAEFEQIKRRLLL